MKKFDLIQFFKNIEGNNTENKTYSNDDIIKLLSIDSDDNKIKSMPFIKVDYYESDYLESTFEIINLDNLVGINRPGDQAVNDWLELLLKLHKQINFNLFHSREKFKKYVQSLNEMNKDLPRVLENDKSQYFIGANGKHRLTIAKCIGMDNFPAIVTRLKGK